MQEKLSTIYARIDKVLKDNGLVKANGSPNYAKAERLCGIKGTVLSKTVKRKGTLGDANKEKFLRTFHVKPEWFDTGSGDIYNKNPTPERSGSEKSNFRTSADVLEAWLADKQKIIEAQEKDMKYFKDRLIECEVKLKVCEERVRTLEEVKKII